jgi:hypothetical protein
MGHLKEWREQMAIALILDFPGVTREQYDTAHGILGSFSAGTNVLRLWYPLGRICGSNNGRWLKVRAQ